MINHPPRSESFWLATWLAIILLALLTVLGIAAYRSPFMVFRLPEKTRAVPEE